MSDAAPDPMDKAYAQAEAVLRDEAARAGRRARVLAAVAREAPAGQPAATARRPVWRQLGWLAAASVAGVTVLLATQFDRPTFGPPPAPAKAPAAAASEIAAPEASPQPAPTPQALERKPGTARRALAAAPPVEAPSAADRAAAAPPPPPAASTAVQEVAPAVQHRIEEPAPPRPAPAPPSGASDVVVTGQRRAPTSPEIAEIVVATDPPGKLRASAAEGRIKDVAALLARGVAVDAADSDGETALMKAIQADQPATAALLRRHGASLDRKNHAGVSARQMATSAGDPELSHALGIEP